MGYYITKTGLSGKTVYWTGGVHWSDNSSSKKVYATKSTADSILAVSMPLSINACAVPSTMN